MGKREGIDKKDKNRHHKKEKKEKIKNLEVGFLITYPIWNIHFIYFIYVL